MSPVRSASAHTSASPWSIALRLLARREYTRAELAAALARRAGTIGYEVLTSLGRRFVRIYKGGDAVAASDSVAEKNEPAAAQAAPPTLPTAAPAASAGCWAWTASRA